jgi:hypothetical protein
MRIVRYLLGVLLLASFLTLIPAAHDECSAQTPLIKLKPGDRPSGILVLDGSPVHDVGELHVHASNWGAFGSQPGSGQTFSDAPSAEWPAGSRVEYLYVAGIWVGALKAGIPAVSTAAFQTEFRPSSDPRDIVYETSFGAMGGNRIPSAAADDDADGALDEDPLDGFDNDLDGLIDEDYAGISDQMLSRRFRDDDPSVFPIYPQHNPMNLSVHEESFQFDESDFDDFVGFTYSITNDGNTTLRDAYVGVFADGDVGHRDTPDYWEDDATGFYPNIPVDHGPHGSQGYDYGYWYDVDGDGGQAAGYGGIVVLDHPVDPTGSTAPTEVGISTCWVFSGSAAYEDGGDPTNDFERYEAMSSRTIQRPGDTPRDYRILIAVGPFKRIEPGQTIRFSFALVVTPRDDFTNVERAAVAYHGLWFDLDGNPNTGIDGKEHQEHWYLPTDPVPITITRFDARVTDASAVTISWETVADETIAGFELLRAIGGGELRPLTHGLIPSDRREFVDVTVTPGSRYEYVLVAHAASGSTFQSQRVGASVPIATLSLGANVPNPFHEATRITVSLPERSDVNVAVFDVSGRRVATIASGVREAGAHELTWDGTNDAGQRVGAGVYFYRLETGKQTLTRKLLLVR